MRNLFFTLVVIGALSCGSAAAQGDRAADPAASQLRRAVRFEIDSFSHSPHSCEGGLVATRASARLLDRQLVVEGTGPRSKEGAFFDLRLGIPMARLGQSGTVLAKELTVVYRHGGEAGLRLLDVGAVAGRVEIRRDDEAGAVVGEFELVLSLPRVDPEYGISRQRLVGSFEARRCREWFEVIGAGRRIAITRADIAHVLLVRGRRDRVVAAKRSSDGTWLVELQRPGRERPESMALDQFGVPCEPVPRAGNSVLRRRSP